MSHGNQSYLRFSLEESVWFQKGQEVKELLSISLDPNITIQESDQYVTIKGSLELSGEYNRNEWNEDEEDEDFSNPKFVQTVEVREEGANLFSHHFPVEITIPKNRIQDLYDIDVTVETFDYAFPERSCLRLSADLMITGLYGEQQHELLADQNSLEIEQDANEEIQSSYFRDPVENNYEWNSPNFEDVQDPFIKNNRISPFKKPFIADEESEDYYKPFVAEAKKVPQEETAENQVDSSIVSLRKEMEEQEKDEHEINMTNNEPFRLEEEKVDQTTPNKMYDKAESDTNEPVKEKQFEINFSSNRNEETSVPENNVTNEQVEVSPENTSEEAETELAENEIESSSSPEQPKKKKGNKWKNKQSLTLSEFFARKAEEEEHSKLRMCIVQNGDTLDSISDRYDVPVHQLQRVNNLELHQDIIVGQVLYIPVSQTQK